MNLNNDIIKEILSEYDKVVINNIDNIYLTKSVEDKDLLVVDYNAYNQSFILLSEYQKRVSLIRNNKINNLLNE